MQKWKSGKEGSLTDLPQHRLAVRFYDNINQSTKYAVLEIAKHSTEMNGTSTMVSLTPMRSPDFSKVAICPIPVYSALRNCRDKPGVERLHG